MIVYLVWKCGQHLPPCKNKNLIGIYEDRADAEKAAEKYECEDAAFSCASVQEREVQQSSKNSAVLIPFDCEDFGF